MGLALSGCDRMPKALDAAGAASGLIADLFWLFTAVAAIVWLLVVAALLAAIMRRRGESSAASPDDGMQKLAARVITGAVAATALTLMGLTVSSYFIDRSLARLADEQALTIHVSARQWWWKAEYVSSDPSRTLTTANEIHIPLGVPVNLRLTSNDVIHSFWVPEIAGKQDLIPGRETVLHILATKPGVYRGQCAEFCGMQHAHMAVVIIVEPAVEYDAWFARQLAPAAEPAHEEARRGRELFLQKPCVMCHRIAGTPAGSRAGPDLTHVASRRGVAANTLPMTRGSLAAWIADPQAIKPGAKMPRTDLSADELNAIVAYLEGLQ